MSKKDLFLRSNDQIRFSPLTVIDDQGVNLGQMARTEALNLASEKGLDLVEINPSSRPPVCKIMDFGRYKYDLSKKEKENRARSKTTELKEIRLTAKIGDHDIEYKAKQARDFFDDGDRVKVSMRLRGRENVFVDNAMAVFAKFKEQTALDFERPPQKAGNQITAMLTERKVKNEIKDTQSHS